MLTRKMAEDLQRLIENLSAQLEAQRLQITALENARQNIGNTDRVQITQSVLPKFDASKIPDAIKMIVTYNGDPKCLSNWTSSVESKLTFAKQLCPTAEDEANAMPLWHSIIRDKIVDKANDVLVQSHTPTEWCEIKKTLEEYFGDKRDLSSLITKINYLQQNSKTIEEFYNECRELLADITAKIMLHQEMRSCAKILTESYECMIINAFIDGLEDPYSALTRTTRPSTLLSAFQEAMDQFNADQRRKEKFRKPATVNQKPAMQIKQSPSYLKPHYNQYKPPYYPPTPKFYPAFRSQNNQNMYRPQGQNHAAPANFRAQFQNSHSPYNPRMTPNENQTRYPAIMNVKPDPSGQRTQGNQNLPSWQKPRIFSGNQNVNHHEESFSNPEENDSQYENENDSREYNNAPENIQPEETEELNFHSAYNQQEEN